MTEKIARYAETLYLAERGRKAVEPFSDLDPEFDAAEGYAVQLENVKRAASQGHRISGKKIGLTSEGIQRQLGVGEPDYGHLFEAMECRSGTVDSSALIQPKIEAEIAFILRSDLTGGHVTADQVSRATDFVCAAFEIVDSRVAGWRIRISDTIADNASSGRYVLGDVRMSPDDLDLARESMRMFKGGQPAGEGSGSAVLGDPRTAVAWLANRMFSFGVELKAGEVILSGAFAAAPAASPGDEFSAVFSNLGTVSARFS